MAKKKKGEAKSTEDDGTDIPSSNTQSGKSYGSAVDDVKHKLAAAKLDDAESAVRLGILQVPGYGSSKLDDAGHGMWLRNLSASQREEYLSLEDG